MQRSKKELAVLKSGYETALLVHQFVGNALSDPDDENINTEDLKWYSDAESYIKWYEKTIIKNQ